VQGSFNSSGREFRPRWRFFGRLALTLGVIGLITWVGSTPGQAAKSGSRRLIVTFKYRDVMAGARHRLRAATNGAPGQQAEDARYISLTSPAYGQRRANVLQDHPGVRLVKSYLPLPVALVETSGAAALDSLEADPRVVAVSGNHTYSEAPPARTPTSLAGAIAQAPTTLQADLEDTDDVVSRATGDRGEGTGVAVLDDGASFIGTTIDFGDCPSAGAQGCSVAAYRAFAGKPPNGYAWFVDDASHGTNVAGQVLKIAPEAKLVVGNVFGKKKGLLVAEDSTILAGLQWVMKQAARRDIRAVNLSLGYSSSYNDEPCSDTGAEQEFQASFLSLRAMNVQPVVAAGNEAFPGGQFKRGISSPACIYPALAVGADYAESLGRQDFSFFGDSRCIDETTERDQVACFGQTGGLIGIVAPGVMEEAGGSVFTGTSQATPLVSGAIAALASGSPASSADQITAALKNGGKPLFDPRTEETVPRLSVLGAELELTGGAVITAGNVGLGVNQWGSLDLSGQPPSRSGTTEYGLRYLPNGDELLGPGCPCDGWGVADPGVGVAGYADEAVGVEGLEAGGFTHSRSSATADVLAGSTFEVIHAYAPAPGRPDLFRDHVTITNVSGSPVQEALYRRVADWDMEPTAFDEFVTVQYSPGATKLVSTSNDGFASPNPLLPESTLGATGRFFRFGPLDQGAQFNFNLGPLAPDESVSFDEYIGAAANQTAAYKDLKAIGAQAYSLGEPNVPSLGLGAPNTAILAFVGIGGSRAPLPRK
jgi:subtilisin family serine protease